MISSIAPRTRSALTNLPRFACHVHCRFVCYVHCSTFVCYAHCSRSEQQRVGGCKVSEEGTMRGKGV